MEYPIGAFSRMSRLTIKALRFYHEQGLLEPVRIDGNTGYRFYDEGCLVCAEAITWLRGLDFSIQEIKELLAPSREKDADLVGLLRRKAEEVARKAKHYRRVKQEIESFLAKEAQRTRLAMEMAVAEKILEDVLIAGVRFRGRYDEAGKRFGALARIAGRAIAGDPFSLYYDAEFKEEDADIEVAFPIRAPIHAEGIDCRVLSGGRVVSLVHRGPYSELGRSYRRLIDFVGGRNLTLGAPIQEVYLRGPGMLFPGNPKEYLTDIRVRLDHGERLPTRSGGARGAPPRR
jgi:DNA-binding transcriptional MerR regulator/effector-binding domain-containing protein